MQVSMDTAGKDADPLIGETVGSYRVERLIGAGGMGRVYEAVQPTIGARVAIKVIAERDIDPELRGRFFAEARAVNLIRHERIVNIIDLRTLHDGTPCIIMEFLDGASLETLLEDRVTLPIGTLMRLAGEILDALEAAHQEGIIHRDLKPANVHVTPEGHAKLVDFGIAKLQGDAASHRTAVGVVVGTVPYMSPEQAAGDELDGRSDLFSLGVLLYEALAGTRPFVGDNVFTLEEEHRRGPEPLETARPEVPEAVRALVMQALQLEPGRRFASAAAMKAAVVAVCEGLPKQAFESLEMQEHSSKHVAVTAAPTGTTAATVKAGGGGVPTADTPVQVPRRSVESMVSETRGSYRGLVFAGLGLAVLAGALVLWSRGEPAHEPAPVAVYDSGPRKEFEPRHHARPAGPIDAAVFLERALRLAEEQLGEVDLVRMVATDVHDDGLAHGTMEVVVSPTGSSNTAARVSCASTEIVVEPTSEAELVATTAPKCTLGHLYAIFAAAGGGLEDLRITYDHAGWELSSGDGSMRLDDSLCGMAPAGADGGATE